MSATSDCAEVLFAVPHALIIIEAFALGSVVASHHTDCTLPQTLANLSAETFGAELRARLGAFRDSAVPHARIVFVASGTASVLDGACGNALDTGPFAELVVAAKGGQVGGRNSRDVRVSTAVVTALAQMGNPFALGVVIARGR